MKKAFICIVLAVTWGSAAVWSAPRADATAVGRVQLAPVPMHVLRVPAGLPVAPAAVTLDAGRRFTMAGVICAAPSAPGATSVRLRTSLDGNTWGPWNEAPLELAAEAGGPPRAFTEPVWTGRRAICRCRLSPPARRSPA